MTDELENAEGTLIEYQVSTAMRKRLQQMFDHASNLMKQPKYDADYVHTLLGECAKKDPANLIYVEAMMDNLEKKNQGKKKGSFFSAFSGRGLKKLVSSEKWQEVFNQAIDQLKNNPWDTTVLRPLIDACQANRFNEVGLRYLKNSMEGSNNDIEVWRHGARYLGKVGQFDQAIAIWHRVDERKRGDAEANKMISQMTMDKERQRQGLATITNKIDLKPGEKLPVRQTKPKDESPQEAKPKRVIELNDKQLLEKLIVEHPETPENYLKLVDLWLLENKHYEAELVLKKATEAIGVNTELVSKQEEVKIARAKYRVAIAEKQAKVNSNEDSQRVLAEAKDELNHTELDIFGKRSERFPDNNKFRYEYGLRLKRVGNLDEAITEFDQVINYDDHLLPLALLAKGESLQARKKYHTALDCYEEAVSCTEDKTLEQEKLMLYRAGVLALALEELSLSKKYLSRLLKIDPNYRDTKSRVDKLKKMLHID